MQIEKMTRKHIDEVYEISKEQFKDSWTKQMFLQELENKFRMGFVAVLNGQVAGFVNFLFLQDEMTILKIATKECFKGQKIAFNLLDKSLTFAKDNGVSVVFLEVEDGNNPAIKLYEKFGFEVLKRRKNYYQGKIDAIEMFLNI